MSAASEALRDLSPSDKRALLARLLREKERQPKRFALSFAQQRLWFLYQFDPTSPAYNIGSAVRMRGEVSIPVLAACLGEIGHRHETLRTTFETVEGEPVQQVWPQLALRLPVIDLSALPPAVCQRLARQLIEADSRVPFDLGCGPLLRTILLVLADDEVVMGLRMHHIVSDGWSMRVLIQELVGLYSSFVTGKPSPLPELPIQYADFAEWQRRWLQGEALERQLDYWRRHLSDSPPVLELPFDRPRPAVQTFRGGLYDRRLEAGPSAGVRALARAEKATLYMTFLAAFKVLLSRVSGYRKVAVGTPIANRQQLSTELLIGFFANTLVLSTDLSGDPSFRTLLARVKQGTLQAYEHQDLPFEKLVEELQPARSMSHSPLFQVVFTWREAVAYEALELPGMKLSSFTSETGAAPFDLSLEVTDAAEGITTAFIYNADLFAASTVKRLARSLYELLASIVENPGRRLSEHRLLSPAERHQLLREWNDAPCATADERGVHQLFEAWAGRDPDRTALTFEPPGEARSELTYGQLNRAANRLAHHLRALGVGPEVPVGLCLERSGELLVGLLGILKAGGAYVPLDPSYPAERLALILEDALGGVDRAVVVTQESLAAALPVPGGTRVVCLDRDRVELRRRPASDPAPRGGGSHLAYVIFTSGSTGRPKGVAVEHANVRSLLVACDPHFGFGPRDVWTLFHSSAFDFSVWEIWGALAYGGRLVVVPRELTRSPEAFYRLLDRERVTVLNATPSVFRALTRVDRPEVAARLALRCVIFGGEALELQSLEPWYANRPRDAAPQLINMYGITETTVHVTLRMLSRRDVRQASGSVIGNPLPHLGLYLLDASSRPVPIGVGGEIHVGGTGLARGYLGQPRLTAERFVPAFGDQPGARLYRSGDLARRLAGGDTEYLGRIDHQVKLRGFRIELGEIESGLCHHPAVGEAVVTLHGETPGEERLVAYVVPRGDEAPAASALRTFLAERLPDYMVPSNVVFLEALPMTANGKVNRRALPSPAAGREALAEEYLPPRGELERTIAGLWREVLGVDQVGREDNFFELGGHSLVMVQVRDRLREILRRELSLTDLFRYPTVSSLAGFLAAPAGPAAAAEERDAELGEGRARLRQLQQRRRGGRSR